MEINAVVLAGGKGTRMKSEIPKCAHIIIDKPMVEYVIDSLRELKIKNIVTIVGYGKEEIIKLVDGKTKFAVQEEQLGTAHAVMQAESILNGKEGITIIAIGDVPFIKRSTFYSLLISHMQEQADLTVMTVDHPEPSGYGRILRNKNGDVIRIIEDRDCTKEQTAIREINSSIYAVDNELLFKYLKLVNNNNAQNEYYLTDLVELFIKNKHKVNGFKTGNYKEISGINNKVQLLNMEQAYQDTILEEHLLNGVTLHNPQTLSIGKDVVIEDGVTIMPNTIITGVTKIKRNSIIGPNTVINNSTIGPNSNIFYSVIKESKLKSKTEVGPFKNIVNGEEV